MGYDEGESVPYVVGKTLRIRSSINKDQLHLNIAALIGGGGPYHFHEPKFLV